jgi:protein SCO1/2
LAHSLGIPGNILESSGTPKTLKNLYKSETFNDIKALGMASQAYDEGSIPFTRSIGLAARQSSLQSKRGRAMMTTVVTAGLGLALCASCAKGDDARIAFDDRFSLVDADGKIVTSADFPGKWLLIYFGYMHCSDQCPTALSAMAEALDEIGPAGRHVQPLFISVDPERDRGPMLRDFTAAFDQRLIGLTGTQEQISDVAHAVGVTYEKVLLDNSDYVVDHSSTLSVVDPWGGSAVTFTLAEPYMIAAKLLELIDRSGAALGPVNNLGAYR